MNKLYGEFIAQLMATEAYENIEISKNNEEEDQ